MEPLPKHMQTTLKELIKGMLAKTAPDERQLANAYLYLVKTGTIMGQKDPAKPFTADGVPPQFFDALLALPEEKKRQLGIEFTYQGFRDAQGPALSDNAHALSVVPRTAAAVKDAFKQQVASAIPSNELPEPPARHGLLSFLRPGGSKPAARG